MKLQNHSGKLPDQRSFLRRFLINLSAHFCIQQPEGHSVWKACKLPDLGNFWESRRLTLAFLTVRKRSLPSEWQAFSLFECKNWQQLAIALRHSPSGSQQKRLYPTQTATVKLSSLRVTARYIVSRSNGSRPASVISRTRSARRIPCGVVAPAS